MKKWLPLLLFILLGLILHEANAVLFPGGTLFYGSGAQGYVTFSDSFTASKLTCDGYVRFEDFTWGTSNFGSIDFMVDVNASLTINQVTSTLIGGAVALTGSPANVTIYLPGKTVYTVAGAAAYTFSGDYLKLKFTSDSPALLIQLTPLESADVVIIMPDVAIQSGGLLQVASGSTATSVVVTEATTTFSAFTFGSVVYNSLILGASAGENITIFSLQPTEMVLNCSSSSASENIIIQVAGKVISYVLGATSWSGSAPTIIIPVNGASTVTVLFSGSQGGFTYLPILLLMIVVGLIIMARRRH